MRIKKNLSILTALTCSLFLSSAAVAEEYLCEVTSYSGSLGALKKTVDTNRLAIVKSLIPNQFILNSCGLTFQGWEQILLEKPPKKGLYFAKANFKINGQTIRPRYRVHIQEEGKGYISMKLSTKHKKMGPVPFMCELVEDSASSDTCAEQEDQ
jgi:hypothetical protein